MQLQGLTEEVRVSSWVWIAGGIVLDAFAADCERNGSVENGVGEIMWSSALGIDSARRGGPG
jgi:hypothetical protein